MRSRYCDSPSPQHGGADCSGCGVEYATCGHEPCGDARRVTAWTPWLTGNDTDPAGISQRRFRFSCRAPVDASLLRVGAMKMEERLCPPDGTCYRTGKRHLY